jgi:hypothetical protein
MSKRSHFYLGWCLLLALSLTACAGSDPNPNNDGAILGGFDDLPKALATIELTATPIAEVLTATFISLQPTPTYAPPTFTPTPTPYDGIFMGNITPDVGTLIYRPTPGSPLYIAYGAPSGAVGPSGPVVVPPPLLASGTTPGAPLVGNPPSNPGAPCAVQTSGQFANALNNANVRARLGCPTGDMFTLGLVGQPFQGGYMVWRDTKEIYILLGNSESFFRVVDAWTEGMAADDPALTAPQGFLQPVRGFGLAWRSNPTLRERLGWALTTETPYNAVWQPFERGWLMLGPDGRALAVAPNDANPNTSGVYFGAN